MTAAGFNLVPGEHPIIPVMLGDAKLAARVRASGCSTRASTSSASRSRSCPQGKARIRTQMSAAHTREQLDRAVAAFAKVGTRAAESV